MPARLQTWLVPVVTGVAGLTTGLLVAGREPGPREPGMAAPMVAAVAGPACLTAEDVRRVIREEFASHVPEPARAAGPATAALPASAAQVAARSEAQAILDNAIARRSWVEADADAMRATFDELTAEHQAEFLRQYAVAVNQGRLVPQTERVPF